MEEAEAEDDDKEEEESGELRSTSSGMVSEERMELVER
jgi:hypothetical protein